MPSLPSTNQVAKAFGKAASTYDDAAILQQQVANALAQRCQAVCHGRVMDFGCGTGYLSQQLLDNTKVTHITGVDIAPAMVALAKQRFAQGHIEQDPPTQQDRDRHNQQGLASNPRLAWVVDDGQTMAIAPNTFDTIVSSLAIQWCADLTRLLANFAGALSSQGHVCLATLGPQSMQELRQAWQQVDDFQHVNEFLPKEQLLSALQPHFEVLNLTTDTITLTFDTVAELTRNLKQLGVGNRTYGARRGLTTRGQWRAMQTAYEGWRNAQGKLPLTYEVIYITGQKRCRKATPSP